MKPQDRETAASSNGAFDLLRALIKRHSGIQIEPGKEAFVESRLSKRMRDLGLSSLTEYFNFVAHQDEGGELSELINLVSTNTTHFFREAHHYALLEREVLAPAVTEAKSGLRNRRLRFWSAASSTGQEAYSLAATIAKSVTDHERWDIKILGTDIDSSVVNTARLGLYPQGVASQVPATYQDVMFEPSPVHGHARIKPELRRMTVFNHMNLLGQWPMSGQFDAIFCRNVFIYFDLPTQNAILERMSKLLGRRGLLFLGHSEVVNNAKGMFEKVGQTTYALKGWTPWRSKS